MGILGLEDIVWSLNQVLHKARKNLEFSEMWIMFQFCLSSLRWIFLSLQRWASCCVPQCCNCLNKVLTLLVDHYQHLNCFSTMTWIPSCSIHLSLLIWRNTVLYILSIFITHSKSFDFHLFWTCYFLRWLRKFQITSIILCFFLE